MNEPTFTTQQVLERLSILSAKEAADGLYVRQHTVDLAFQEIERLRAELAAMTTRWQAAEKDNSEHDEIYEALLEKLAAMTQERDDIKDDYLRSHREKVDYYERVVIAEAALRSTTGGE